MSETQIPIALFRLGKVYATPNALKTISHDDIVTAIRRHHSGDWGDLSGDDRRANDCAMINGSRLFSVYYSATRVKFWIVTEANRASTTILLPEDY